MNLKHKALPGLAGGAFYLPGMDEKRLGLFKEKLDKYYAWPSLYTFKFIVPKGKEGDLKKFFPLHNPKERNSKNGNYTSITIPMMMPSAEAVVEVYVSVSHIEGIIAL